MDVSQLRRNYKRGSLEESDVPADPMELFQRWLEAAQAADLLEPNAMILATVSSSGLPSARAVLLKGLDERGFVFYTNYESRKGHEIAENPNVALVFNWLGLERQVRVEGTASRIPREETEAYHKTRPHGSQLGEWVSPQSREIESRAVLDERLAEYEAKYPDDVPLPEFWGGYRVAPRALEFWQGRENRLHDRFRYTRQGSAWSRVRLAP